MPPTKHMILDDYDSGETYWCKKGGYVDGTYDIELVTCDECLRSIVKIGTAARAVQDRLRRSRPGTR